MAIITLFLIGFGFFWVIKLEYHFGACIKRIILFSGIIIVVLSLFINQFFYAALLGLIGGTVIWGSTEMEDQEERSDKGMFPNNPNKFCNKKKKNFLFTSKKLKNNGNH